MAFRPFLPPIESTMHVSSGRWLYGLLLALTTALLWGILPIKLKEVLQVLDPVTVGDHATYDDPHRYSTGVHHVVVNGEPVVESGVVLDARPGRRLRRGG